jgi:hypothetical protein
MSHACEHWIPYQQSVQDLYHVFNSTAQSPQPIINHFKAVRGIFWQDERPAAGIDHGPKYTSNDTEASALPWTVHTHIRTVQRLQVNACFLALWYWQQGERTLLNLCTALCPIWVDEMYA